MSKEITTSKFDDSALTKEDKGKLVYIASQIRKHWAAGQRSIVDIGEYVAQAHAVLAKDGCDGKFSDWVRCEFGLSKKTAYNYMHAWEAFGEVESIGQFDATAMYELARMPEPVIKQAIKMAEKGQRIHAAEAKQLKQAYDEKHGKTSGINRETVTQLPPTNPQASVTGTQQTIPASPPGLPSVGTANRTEPGSQGSGDAGECPAEDYGKCPNCAGTKWKDDAELGLACSKCHHPHGEPAGEVDDQRKTDARSKTIKTAEALMRAFDDLNLLASHPKEHANAIATCKILLKTARDWR